MAQDLYPHKFEVSMTLGEFCNAFGSFKDGDRVSLAGRMMEKHVDAEVTRYVLECVDGKLQAFADTRMPDLVPGGVVGITGCPRQSELGPGITVESMCVLAPCLRLPLPERGRSQKEQELWRPGKTRNAYDYPLCLDTRYNDRILDLIVNPDIKSVFTARCDTENFIRAFLQSRGVKEVYTGIVQPFRQRLAVDAFQTHHNELNQDMFLRVSANQLLQLIVAGNCGVFEIGKQFRNEAMNPTHHPEFTTCEMCQAYADYKDLMEMTEELVSGLVKKITGGYQVAFHKEGHHDVVDFSPPFRRIEVVKGLEDVLGVQFPEDLASEDAIELLRGICESNGLLCDPPLSTASLLHSLVGRFLEPTCVNPTFIVDYPQMSFPVAKRHSATSVLAEHFKLFVNGIQLVNAFTQCSDPRELRERPATAADNELLTLLEYGLPPCAGWAMGIDRMAMLLTDSVDIKEVLFYPRLYLDNKVVLVVRCLQACDFRVSVDLRLTVSDFKRLLAPYYHDHPAPMRILFKGADLDDDNTLESCGLKGGDAIDVIWGNAKEAANSKDFMLQDLHNALVSL